MSYFHLWEGLLCTAPNTWLVLSSTACEVGLSAVCHSWDCPFCPILYSVYPLWVKKKDSQQASKEASRHHYNISWFSPYIRASIYSPSFMEALLFIFCGCNGFLFSSYPYLSPEFIISSLFLLSSFIIQPRTLHSTWHEWGHVLGTRDVGWSELRFLTFEMSQSYRGDGGSEWKSRDMGCSFRIR